MDKKVRIAVIVCAALGLLSLCYYLAIIIYVGFAADFSLFWLALALMLFGAAFAVNYGRVHPGIYPGWLCKTAIAVVAVGAAVFLLIVGQIWQGMRTAGSDGLDYLIVLGAQVRGEVPSRSLEKRLQRALEYAQENEHTMLVLSGGKGSGEDISEAECMRRYLSEHGISEDRMILEDRSTSTRENLKFSDALTGCASARTGIVTNDFHVYRALCLAKKMGYAQAEGIAASSDLLLEVHYIVREVFALVKEKLSGNV